MAQKVVTKQGLRISKNEVAKKDLFHIRTVKVCNEFHILNIPPKFLYFNL